MIFFNSSKTFIILKCMLYSEEFFFLMKTVGLLYISHLPVHYIICIDVFKSQFGLAVKALIQKPGVHEFQSCSRGKNSWVTGSHILGRRQGKTTKYKYTFIFLSPVVNTLISLNICIFLNVLVIFAVLFGKHVCVLICA